jgi:ADP-heptose:LPS heptosyltransferase
VNATGATMKILVVRHDNIGDLVCTTPLFTALRRRHPRAWIGALVNSYNAPILDRNPDLDEVVSYRKLKHLDSGDSALGALAQRARSLWRLRRMRLDVVALAAPGAPTRGLTLARWLKPRQIAGFDDGSARTATLDLRAHARAGEHEVEQVFALARLFGVEGGPPALTVRPDPAEVERAAAALAARPGRRIALHISARRPSQRWPVARHAELARRLAARYGARVMLLWSPGAGDHPQHPGDDEKAAGLAAELGPAGVLAYPTATLPALIGALAACDEAILSDGGAMHIAAALGKPIVALFGDSPVERWRPWHARHRVVRAESRDLADLPVEAVLEAYEDLRSA